MRNLSNLPPGVTVSMIPGNRPEDEEWERLIELPEPKARGILLARGEDPRQVYPPYDGDVKGSVVPERGDPVSVLAYIEEAYELEAERRYWDQMEREQDDYYEQIRREEEAAGY